MKSTRGFKHYLKFWAISTGLYAAYVIYLSYTDGDFIVPMVLSILYVPLAFVAFLFVFDQIFDRIWPTKEKKTDDEFSAFLKTTTTKVNDGLDLSIEDFRRLRESDRFQKSLYQAYQIYLIGETEAINYKFLEKKFKKDSNEYNALMIVINEVKEMTGN